MEYPKNYKVGSYNYELIKLEVLNKKTIKAMYKDSGSNNYEVVIIRENKNTTRIIQGKEAHFKPYKMPSNEEFGTYGWSFNDLTSATQQYNSII